VSTLLVWVRSSSVEGSMCRACGLFLYHDAQHHNLTRGWWGLGALLMPLHFVGNYFSARRLRRETAACFRDPAIASLADGPLPPRRSLASMPTNWLAPGLVLALFLFLVGSSMTSGYSRQLGRSSIGTSASVPSSTLPPGDAVSGSTASVATPTPIQETHDSLLEKYQFTCWTGLPEGVTQGHVDPVPCSDPSAASIVMDVQKSCPQESVTLTNDYFACVVRK